MVMRIKELRKEQGITQLEFAAMMGVAQVTASQWESETALPRARQLPLLAAVLECSISDLFTDNGKDDLHE